MNFNSVFRIILLFLILLITQSFCTQPKELNKRFSNEESVETVGLSNEDGNIRSMVADSLLNVKIYAGAFTYRLNEIKHRLDQINNKYNAERKNLTLVTGGKVFQMNKKYLELKVKIREPFSYTGTSRVEFEATLTNELDMLDVAISNFIKSEQN